MSELSEKIARLRQQLGLGDEMDYFVVNGESVHYAHLEMTLNNFVHSFVGATEDEITKLQHLGSCVGLYFKENFFVIASSHQMRLATREVGYLGQNGFAHFPSANCDVNTDNKDETDFCILHYDSEQVGKDVEPSDFLQLDEQNVGLLPIDERDSFFNISYPTSLQDINYYEPPMRLTSRSFYAKNVADTSIQFIHTFTFPVKGEYVEDGLSGSPIFQLRPRLKGSLAVFSGIVILGGDRSKIGRFISARQITSALSMFLKRVSE